MFLQAHVFLSNIVREGIIFETAWHCGISSVEDVPIIRSNKCLNYSYNVLICIHKSLLLLLLLLQSGRSN